LTLSLYAMLASLANNRERFGKSISNMPIITPHCEKYATPQ
jgi:glucuronate isomerase